MLNNIISLTIRGGLTFVIGLLTANIVDSVLGMHNDVPTIIAIIVFIIGGIYSLSNFNNPYNITAVKNTDNKISEIIDGKNKQKIEEDMLRVKKLLDSGILTEDEFNHKIKLLKSKYL
jgi:uncharacterized membrane protein YuzA (DUF378 family)